MRSIFHILIVLASVLLLSAGAFAQMGTAPGMMPVPGAQSAADIPGSTLIGKNVTNPQGVTLGKISDFLVDRNTGRIPIVLMQSSVTPGYEDRVVAIPFQAMSLNPATNALMVNLAPEQVAQAPSFSKSEIANINRTAETQVYQYYGLTPYWEESPMMRPMPPSQQPTMP